MRVPDYIRFKMHRLAAIEQEAIVLSKEIDQWFEKKGFDIDKLRSGSGCSLEELEYGVDITDEFCALIESGEMEV